MNEYEAMVEFDTDRENQQTHKKMCPGVTLFTENRAWLTNV
jgi:hypothetical protein